MEHRIMTLFARTPVHVGAGNSVGAVDAPVMRERHTRIPIIPGSSLKGVLAEKWLDRENGRPERSSDGIWLFGNTAADTASAGALLIGEARTLAFPVRSAKNGFAWITCPLVLNRYKRDTHSDFSVPQPDNDNCCFASEKVSVQQKVILEEYSYSVEGAVDHDLVEKLRTLSDDAVWGELGDHLVVVTDGIFCHFAEQACEIVTRVRIDDETGTVAEGALFNQEQVPSETLFYAAVDAQDEKTGAEARRSAADALQQLESKLSEEPVLQVGGDETTGLGLCSVKLV